MTELVKFRDIQVSQGYNINRAGCLVVLCNCNSSFTRAKGRPIGFIRDEGTCPRCFYYRWVILPKEEK